MKIKNRTYLMVVSGLCVALTAVCAQLIIILPFTPVQITLSVCAVYMTGVLLPKRWAVYSQVAYILLGGIGIPIFGKFSGGVNLAVTFLEYSASLFSFCSLSLLRRDMVRILKILCMQLQHRGLKSNERL